MWILVHIPFSLPTNKDKIRENLKGSDSKVNFIIETSLKFLAFTKANYENCQWKMKENKLKLELEFID